MSATAKAKTKEVDGLNEEPDAEVTLFGDDLSALKPVDETTGEPEVTATEGLNSLIDGSTDSTSPKGAPNVIIAGDGNGNVAKPCVSRVIDHNTGNAVITIILGPAERCEHLGIVTGLIDSASENDVVDITVVSSCSGEAGTLSQRSILSAIDRCSGTVITRAGALTTMGDVAIWLAGDDLRIAKMGSIFMRQPISAFFGDTADYVEKAESYAESMREFSGFIVARGLVTQEEMDEMYRSKSMIALYGPKLRQRLANLKAA